jgi:short-subunit dehydrogenase
MEIRDHHILITGGNRGIGKAVALRFAEDKAHLHIAARSKDDNLKQELLKAGAASVEIYEADLSSRENIEKFLKKIDHLNIDILFNNAGQLTGGLLEEQNLDDIYSMLQVNVNALIHLTHGILPKMLKRKKGKIINHSSVSAIMHFPCGSTYSAAKAAVFAFTNSLRAELKGSGVTALTLITPGVDTRMYQEIPNLYGSKLDLSFMRSIPPKKYADMVREAVIEDLEILKPHGFSGVGLMMAQHLPNIFESLVLSRFKR